MRWPQRPCLPAWLTGAFLASADEPSARVQAHITVDQNYPEGAPRKIIVQVGGGRDAAAQAAPQQARRCSMLGQQARGISSYNMGILQSDPAAG